MKLEHFLKPYTKINSWVKDLNVRPNTIKLLAEYMNRTLSAINHKTFLDPPLRVMHIKTIFFKWDLINLNAFAQKRKS